MLPSFPFYWLTFTSSLSNTPNHTYSTHSFSASQSSSSEDKLFYLNIFHSLHFTNESLVCQQITGAFSGVIIMSLLSSFSDSMERSEAQPLSGSPAPFSDHHLVVYFSPSETSTLSHISENHPPSHYSSQR
jgi:hypothetical protein